MKIRTKLIITHLLIMLILLGSLTYVLVKRSSDLVFDNIIENANLSLAQVRVNLDHKLGSYEDIANTLYLNTSLQTMLMKHFPDLRDAYDEYFANYEPLDSAMKITQNVSHLIIYTDNPSFVFANFHLIDTDIKNSDWYQEVIKSPFGAYWTAPYRNEFPAESVFSLRKRLNKEDSNSPIVVSIEVNVSVLNELIHEESKGKRFIFTMPNGVVLVDSSDTNPIKHLDELSFSKEIQSSAEGKLQYKDGKETYEVLYQTLNTRNVVKGMKVITLIPVTELMPKINKLKSLSFILFVGACMISAALIFAFSLGLTRRFTELSSKMRRVHKDNFQSFIDVKGKDEVAQLGQIFNVMVKRLGQLVNERYQSEIDRQEQALRTREVELYALQAQIKPHFLFNILNTIRGKLLIAGDRENAHVVGLLAKSFRMMLKSGGQSIRLTEEIEFIEIYLQLQSYRYVDKFVFDIQIPDAMNGMTIPKLCLQPLVENAISHGIELKKENSQIWIRGEFIEGNIHFIVRDDGLGISPERLEEIHGWLEQDGALSRDQHIGLQNVHRRLRDLYGEGYGLRIESEAGQGTQVTMIIPEQPFGRGDSDV